MNATLNEPSWTEKDATLSDKTAQKEFDLTFQEILDAIKAGKLQFRKTSIYGNPSLRLLRQEVEVLVSEKHGPDYLQERQLKKELADVKKTLSRLKFQTHKLEKRKAELRKILGDA